MYAQPKKFSNKVKETHLLNRKDKNTGTKTENKKMGNYKIKHTKNNNVFCHYFHSVVIYLFVYK